VYIGVVKLVNSSIPAKPCLSSYV